MAEHPFRKALKRTLWPALKAEGFVGTGTTLRRIQGPVIHIVNIQGSSSGHDFYINLGAHLDFLSPIGGHAVAVSDLMEYDCAFRGRIEPPTGPSTGWFYPRDPDERSELIALIVEECRTEGNPFFQRYSSFPDSFRTLLSASDALLQHPIGLRTYALIALRLNDSVLAALFARVAINRAPKTATLLRTDLEQILRESGGQVV